MKRSSNFASGAACLAVLFAACVSMGDFGQWRDRSSKAHAADVPAPPPVVKESLTPPLKPAFATPAAPPVASVVKSDPIPTQTPQEQLQAALAATLAAKTALDKATADETAAKKAVETSTSTYSTALAAYYALANQILPAPVPAPINPDNVAGDMLIIVHQGATVRPWEAAEAQAAIKASGISAYAYDATSLTLNAVQKQWVDHARADGPLPWIGVIGTTGGTRILYHGKADDGKLLDVVKAFAKKSPTVVDDEPDAAEPAKPAIGSWKAADPFGGDACPAGCTTCPKGTK